MKIYFLSLVIFCLMCSNQKEDIYPNFDIGIVAEKKIISQLQLKSVSVTMPVYESKTTNNCMFTDNFGGKFIAPIKTFDIGDSLNSYFKKRDTDGKDLEKD